MNPKITDVVTRNFEEALKNVKPDQLIELSLNSVDGDTDSETFCLLRRDGDRWLYSDPDEGTVCLADPHEALAKFLKEIESREYEPADELIADAFQVSIMYQVIDEETE